MDDVTQQNTAAMYGLIGTAWLNGITTEAWLCHVLMLIILAYTSIGPVHRVAACAKRPRETVNPTVSIAAWLMSATPAKYPSYTKGTHFRAGTRGKRGLHGLSC
jgi:hypothetical protein